MLYWRENSVINPCYNMAPKITSDISRKLQTFVFSEHTKTVMCNCLTEIVQYLHQTWNFSTSKSLFYWIKIAKYVKVFKTRGTGCYDINITCMQYPEDDRRSLNFELRVNSQFFLHFKKKMVKLSVKTRWRFDMVLLINKFIC